jgi:iron(III) transport system ATP-binding protein
MTSHGLQRNAALAQATPFAEQASTPAPAQGGADVVIRARGLTKRFKSVGGEVRALHQVDLDVARAQMLVLLGPSGCGKTTLLRCIGGLENPTEGQVFLAGQLFTSVGEGINLPPERRNLGMMFQSFGLWPHMTVAENVAYPLKNRRGVARAEIVGRVAAMLETMGVAALGDRYPGQLSGGQQQRVALARALVASPTALLFDEPLSNVDAQVRKRLREEIRQMKIDRGFAGVYVTHDQEEAMALADVLAVMQDGEIRQIGAPWEIYRRPRSLYVAHFVGEANTLPARVAVTDGRRIIVDTDLGKVAIDDMETVPQPGHAGQVVLRPEDIRITRRHAGAPEEGRLNLFQGRVVSSILLGPHLELQVAVGNSLLRAWTESVRPDVYTPQSLVDLEIAPLSAAWISE